MQKGMMIFRKVGKYLPVDTE